MEIQYDAREIFKRISFIQEIYHKEANAWKIYELPKIMEIGLKYLGNLRKSRGPAESFK